MKSETIFATIAGAAVALGACGVAAAGGLGSLKDMAGGGTDVSSLTSGSAGNAAGVVEYCVKNNYLSGDAAGSVKDKLLGKIGGDSESDTDKQGYADGANGLLKTGDGKSVDLSKLGGGAGGLKDSLTKKVCSSVLDQAKSFL